MKTGTTCTSNVIYLSGRDTNLSGGEAAPMENNGVNRPLETLIMPAGHLPDFEGKPVLASCENCYHLRDQSDGPEYGPSWYACEKKGKEHMNNLKGFPFKTPQKCCELDIAFLVDWDAEGKRMDAESEEVNGTVTIP